MEQKVEAKITFQDVATGKIIVISLSPDRDDNWDVVIDFGEGGLESHGEGMYAGLCNTFCDTVLGMFIEEEEAQINTLEQ